MLGIQCHNALANLQVQSMVWMAWLHWLATILEITLALTHLQIDSVFRMRG